MCWPASQPVTETAAEGPLDTIMHSVPCGPASGGPANSSSLESQPVMVRFQLEVHSGPSHAGDGRGCIRCSQCQAHSSSHYDAGGQALSALRAGLILFSEPTISHNAMMPQCHDEDSRRSRSELLHPVLFQLILDLMQAACSTSSLFKKDHADNLLNEFFSLSVAKQLQFRTSQSNYM